MPVGCLGVGSRSHADSSLYLDNIDRDHSSEHSSAQVSDQVETIALLQDKLLIQIIRSEDTNNSDKETGLRCSTCQHLSGQCCQVEQGWTVMASFVRANCEAVWNQPLVRAVNSLIFQGYICPGYLITSSSSEENIQIIRDAWTHHALISPEQFKIHSLAVSSGFSVSVIKQSPSPSLQDALCVVLSRLKLSNTEANMENIVARLNTDYSQIPVPKDFIGLIHKTLGALIKTRKVYYTGKGYFLAMPDNTAGVVTTWSDQFKQFIPDSSVGGHKTMTSVGQETTDGADTGLSATSPGSYREINGIHVRHAAQVNGYNKTSPLQSLSPVYSTAPRSSPARNHQSVTNTSLGSEESESSPSSHLERSQSFKMSKKAQKSFAKGGSLRLSKREVVALKQENDMKTNTEEVIQDSEEEESPKKMERKGSVLGRLFGRKKSNPQSPKKEILTFSAQFPPPDLLENIKLSQKLSVSNTTETQTPPSVKKKPSLPARPALASAEELKQRMSSLNTPPTPTLTTSQRSGPSGNFVVFERSNRANSQSPSTPSTLRQSPLSPVLSQKSPMSPMMSQRPLPQSPGQHDSYGVTGVTGHIYSQPSHYGSTPGHKPPPPAYSHAPPYRAKDTTLPPPLPMLQLSPPSPHKYQRANSQPKQVHFAATPRSSDRSSPLTRSSPGCRSASSDGSSSTSAGSSSISGPSSIESSQALYDDTLVVIEKSNQELEQRLGRAPQTGAKRTTISNNRVDTIHNNRLLDQEIIFEESSDMSRSSSVSTLKPDNHHHEPHHHHPHRDSLPDHPSLADMGSIADLSGKFQSLTARKLMAGLSISSIDTLLEVNAAHDPHKLSILNESTETIDFGVI